uniref:Uncharacterized protein n=1 Tax=Salix viminalis TaxID=40686 RepID=A0A6N2M3D2_SALVM
MARRSHVRRDPAVVFVFELRNVDFYHLELTKPGLAKTTSLTKFGTFLSSFHKLLSPSFSSWSSLLLL